MRLLSVAAVLAVLTLCLSRAHAQSLDGAMETADSLPSQAQVSGSSDLSWEQIRNMTVIGVSGVSAIAWLLFQQCREHRKNNAYVLEDMRQARNIPAPPSQQLN